MKLTLLEIVESVLSAMDSDPVNSISDTEEAGQIAQVAEEIYYQLINDTNKDWAFLKKIRELESVSDSDRPTYLKIPDNVSEIYWIKYNVTNSADTNTKYRELKYLNPDEFIDMCHSRNSSESNVVSVTGFNSVEFFIKDDEHPHFWTSFDDEYIVTDSYNSDEESTHQASRSVIYALEEPTFTQNDDFVPDLPSKMFPTYLAQVKTASFFYFKQLENPLDNRASKRGRNVMLNKESRSNGQNFKGFGRK